MKTWHGAAVAVIICAVAANASADVTSTVVDLMPSPGITQRILYVRPDAPIATIVGLPGGDGTLGLTNDGIATSQGQCFPVYRVRQALANMGIALALVDYASDGSVYRYANVAAVVQYAQQQADVPIWVVGGSASTNPAAYIVNALPPSDRVGAVFFSTDNPDPPAIGKLLRPALVVYNVKDPGQAATSFYAALTSASVKQLIALSGGTDSNCGFHLFQGLEAPFANAVGTFIAANNSATALPARLDFDQHGLTGSWYNAATDGQGMELEFFVDAVALGTAYVQGAWFTYDVSAGAADRQRWYTYSGNAKTGDTSIPVTLYQNTGGNFDAAPTTNAVAVGTGTLSFSDCGTGSFSYTFTDGSSRSSSIPLARLTKNVTCAEAGASKATNPDFALSGNWYDPTTSGQGFVVEVNPASATLFMTWYTYAAAGQAAGAAGQRWFTAQSAYTPGARSEALTLYETTGGVFNAGAPVPQTNAVGTATLTFASCTSATFNFSFTSGSNAGHSGTIVLSRIGPTPAGC